MQINLHELRRIIREELKHLSEHGPSEHGDASVEALRAAQRLPLSINPVTDVPHPKNKDEFLDNMSRISDHPEVIMGLKPGTRIAVRIQGSPGAINVDDFAFGHAVGIAKTGGMLGMGAQKWFVVEFEKDRIPYSEESLSNPDRRQDIYAHQDDFAW